MTANHYRSHRALVGRDAELAGLSERLEEPGTRLLTILGPPGIGKSRLLRALADRRSARVIGLSGITDETDLSIRVARALDAELAADGSGVPDPVAQLGRVLSARAPVTLFLDEAEGLAAAEGSAAFERWLASIDGLQLVAASRIAFRTPSEEVFELAPLGVPSELASLAEVAASAAVSLFVKRAQAARRHYTLNEHNAVWVARVVRRLDGIPLALELAGAKMAAMGERELLERLSRALVDVGASRNTGRQGPRSLRGAIESSWSALSREAQDTLCCLSVLRGAFDLQTARSLIAALRGDRLEGDPADWVEGLCLHSLIQVEPAPGLGGEVQYRVLEIVRAYASERLAEREGGALLRALEQAHATLFIETGNRLAASVPGPASAEALHRIALAEENLRLVHARGLSRGRPQWVVGAALALEPLLARRGPRSLQLTLLREAAHACKASEGAGSASESSEVAEGDRPAPGNGTQIELALLRCLVAARELDGVEPRLRALAARAEASEDMDTASVARSLLGRALCDAGRLEAGRTLLRAACDEVDQGEGRAVTPAARAQLFYALGSALIDTLDTAAESALREAEEACQRAGDEDLEAAVLTYLAYVHIQVQTGDPIAECDTAIALAQRGRARLREAAAWTHRGAALFDQGRSEEAIKSYETARQLAREMGQRVLSGVNDTNIGLAREDLNDNAEARKCYIAALSVFSEAGVGRYEAWCSTCLAGLEASVGAIGRAERILSRSADLGGANPELAALLRLARARVAAAKGEPLAGEDFPESNRSVVVRAARRLLARDHARRDASRSPQKAATLRVEDRGRRVWLPSGERLDLGRRGAVRRVLTELARRNAAACGARDVPEALTVDDLFEVGWPNDDIRPTSARMRVHWAVRELRLLGLSDYLVWSEEGYRLSQELDVLLDGSTQVEHEGPRH